MQIISITLECPQCLSLKISKNGLKPQGKQNYLCQACGRQFIGDHALTYQGCHSKIPQEVQEMLVRGCGIRDIAYLKKISPYKVLEILLSSGEKHSFQAQQSYYEALEVDEFWTYVGKKAEKVWLIYAYHRETGEIVAWVWGKRDTATARQLKKQLQSNGIHYGRIHMDDWRSFKKVFGSESCRIGKVHTVGIEGNNCRLRHRIRRAFRKTCNFSKKLINHYCAFELAFFYINYGFV